MQNTKLGFPYALFECANKHRWPMLIAPWWFNLREVRCPKCQKRAVAMKWGGVAENLKDDIPVEQPDGSVT